MSQPHVLGSDEKDLKRRRVDIHYGNTTLPSHDGKSVVEIHIHSDAGFNYERLRGLDNIAAVIIHGNVHGTIIGDHLNAVTVNGNVHEGDIRNSSTVIIQGDVMGNITHVTRVTCGDVHGDIHADNITFSQQSND